MAGLVDLARLGAILPKTITALPRPGNTPWRTVETPAGMLNSIGLDNDGIAAFVAHHLPYLAGLGTAIVVSIAAHDYDEFVGMAERLDGATGLAAIELNLSCPNVSGGVDFGTDAGMCRRVVAGVRAACRWPILAKLTPNVTDIASIAKAAADGGADAISVINTCLGMAVDWRRRRPLLGNVLGGLSGPAIKPIALRGLPGGSRRGDSSGRNWRHRHGRRRDGVCRCWSDGSANRDGEFLRSAGDNDDSRPAAGGSGRTEECWFCRRGRHAQDLTR